ncbi:hypothetical protein ANN_04241 [Periplaneta americana]|uniref:Uncharacterized protein n=1 Tax=Periplaneta americana TaxID=6978 RepID=A0ABQ8TA18_PERAM|nr:hypothetical protein ANN_04241 [Periplaneta americana]
MTHAELVKNILTKLNIWCSTPHLYPCKKNTQMFGDCVISRHCPTMWPPRSPDFNPADFWLWGYLKE